MIHFLPIIFRFLDFFVIILLFAYGIKYYIIPSVQKKLKEYDLFIDNLDSDYKKLQLENYAMYEIIQDQDRNFQAMQEKFVIWQEKCNDRIDIEKAQQKQIDIVMQNRFEVQSHYIKNDLLVKEQLPDILDAVAYDLHVKYRSVDMQKKYIDGLIDNLKDRL